MEATQARLSLHLSNYHIVGNHMLRLVTQDGHVMFSIFSGIGYSLTTAGIIVNLGYYFQKRRNFMISIIFVVVGVGMFLSAPVGLIIKDTYGLSSSFLILAGMYAQTCVLGMLCKPSSCERKFQKERRTRAKLSKDTLSSHFNFSLICNKPFLCFLISSCTWNFALVTALMHLPNYLKINGGTDSEIGWLMTAFAIANTFGRLGGSLCVRKESINTLTVHIVSIGIAGIITSLFPFYSTNIAGKYSFSILLGFLCGFPNVLMTTLSIRFVGVSMLPEANGLSYFFCGIGVSTGPIVTGKIYIQTDFKTQHLYSSFNVCLKKKANNHFGCLTH